MHQSQIETPEYPSFQAIAAYRVLSIYLLLPEPHNNKAQKNTRQNKQLSVVRP
mgnify:CR=1 FL=1